MRCFLVWLSYGHLLMAILTALTLRRFFQMDLPSAARAWVSWIAWVVYLYRLIFLLNFHLSSTVTRILAGWPSKVMLVKFGALLQDAKEMENDLSELLAKPPPDNNWKIVDIQMAIDEIRKAANNLRFTK